MKKIIGIFLFFLSFSFASFFFLYILYVREGGAPRAQNIVIPHETTKELTKLLREKNILHDDWASALFFRAMVQLTHRDGELHAAELAFPAHVSLQKTLYILRHAHAVNHSVTFSEGLTAKEIEDILKKESSLNGEVPSFPEGGVFPQTYFYQFGMQRSAIITRSENLMREKLTSIWQNRDIEALGDEIQTPEELLILASLIEKETSLPAERALIARVFLNRLKKHMKLQTDPTVIYALTEGRGHLMRPLTHNDLKIQSPYNSYLQQGLPPTAICSPSEGALYAAAHPAMGEMLYFVASGKGGHFFAKTLLEQDAHIRAYRNFQKNAQK